MKKAATGMPHEIIEVEGEFPYNPYFTPNVLRKLFREVLKTGYNPPTLVTLRKLGDRLDDLRHLAPWANGPWREIALERISNRDAISHIERAIPILLQDIRRDRKHNVKDWARDRGSDPDYVALMTLQQAIDQFKARKFLFGYGVLEIDTDFTWKNMAVALKNFFVEAMSETNPGKSFGNKGPVPRFISAVVPHITGELVAVETVAALFNRHARHGGIFPERNPPG